MDRWAGELLEIVDESLDEAAIFARIQAAAAGLGFETCSYGLRVPLPVSNPKVLVVSNHPREWQQHYGEAGYVAIDPTVQHGQRSMVPLIWREEVFANARQFWDEAWAAGLRYGWAQSSLNGPGDGSMLTLSRSSEVLLPSELALKEPRMRWLVNIAHLTMSRAVNRKNVERTQAIHLTRRETEVLKWAADGKTSAEVGDILLISTDTVNFHTKNAIAKLGTANKTAAVVRAAMLGLLT